MTVIFVHSTYLGKQRGKQQTPGNVLPVLSGRQNGRIEIGVFTSEVKAGLSPGEKGTSEKGKEGQEVL